MKIFSLRTKLFPAFIGVRPRLLMLLLFAFAFTGCAEVMDQIDKMANFAKCQFRLASVENAALAGIPLQSANLSDISPLNLIKLQTVFTSGTLPLGFTLNLEVKNPNSCTAGMNKVEWDPFDGQQPADFRRLGESRGYPRQRGRESAHGYIPRLEKDAFGQDPGFHDQPGLECGGGGKQALQADAPVEAFHPGLRPDDRLPRYITVSHEFTSK